MGICASKFEAFKVIPKMTEDFKNTDHLSEFAKINAKLKLLSMGGLNAVKDAIGEKGVDGASEKAKERCIFLSVDQKSFLKHALDMDKGTAHQIGRRTYIDESQLFLDDLQAWLKANLDRFYEKVPTGKCVICCVDGKDVQFKIEDDKLILGLGAKHLGYRTYYKDKVPPLFYKYGKVEWEMDTSFAKQSDKDTFAQRNKTIDTCCAGAKLIVDYDAWFAAAHYETREFSSIGGMMHERYPKEFVNHCSGILKENAALFLEKSHGGNIYLCPGNEATDKYGDLAFTDRGLELYFNPINMGYTSAFAEKLKTLLLKQE